MENSILSRYFGQSKKIAELISLLNKKKYICAEGISSEAKSAFLVSLYEKTKKKILFVTDNALSGYDTLAFERYELRGVECKSTETDFKWLEILFGRQEIICVSPCSLMRKLVLPSRFNEYIFQLKPGQDINPKCLAEKLLACGYEKTDTVYAPGQYAQRGEITDIFSPCTENPVRIIFFDTEVESIKVFDKDSQKTLGEKLGETTVFPASLYLLSDSEKNKALKYFSQYEGEDGYIGSDSAKNIFSIEQTGTFQNIDSFYGSLANAATLFDYFDDAIVVLDNLLSCKLSFSKCLDEFRNDYERLYAAGEAYFAQKEACFSFDEIKTRLKLPVINLSGNEKNGINFGMRAPALFSGNIAELAESIRVRNNSGWVINLCVGGKAASLSNALLEYDIIAPVDGEKARVNVSTDWFGHGFEIPEEKILFFGEGDIYAVYKKNIKKKNRDIEKSDSEIFAELRIGDIVVHEVHGKGRYLGLKTMEAAGSIGEYLELEYKDGDRLYIPSAQISRIQKYIGNGDDEGTSLSKLGSNEWERAKYKARESVKKLAFDLVQLYADRHSKKGYAFSPDTVWQTQFEDDCEYELTDGQSKSVKEIKADMESSRVMDRLVLGDVGYGKTEVAMRAAFKAVMDSKQVCVLVPTTLLARQHWKTFQSRFEGFPVTVDVLSRYSASRQKAILKKLEEGDIDILIGTHKILSDKVKFKRLGLLIVDEEQRFGVGHKEKIKTLKKDVDVITLSATPIPRTLEMSLIGVRDLSMIKTPPVERKEPLSYVMQYSDSLVHDAIKRELLRGGQVYFVVRQIQQITRTVNEIRRLVPEANVEYAHGQMNSTDSERVVERFLDGEINVLVCTTIIESGIDIPSVNTIIIYEADKFGLSQLYQLRGRVGRSDRTSFAYFTFLSENMGENARKRLDAIREFTSFGSGFKIAMRDLQIRGAGNLLGPEQSGHLMNVGYALYCKMMRDAIRNVQDGEIQSEEIDTSVDLGVPAYIPADYISEDQHKLDMYKRIARITDITDAKKAASELTDIYGQIPQEVVNLIACAIVRLYAQSAGIASVIRKADVYELIYDKNYNINIEKIMNYLQVNKQYALLRPTEPPTLVFKKKDVKSLVAFLNGLKHCK